MHTYLHTYIHIYMHTYIHAYIHAYIHTYIHIHTHACTYTRMHKTCIQTSTREFMREHTRYAQRRRRGAGEPQHRRLSVPLPARRSGGATDIVVCCGALRCCSVGHVIKNTAEHYNAPHTTQQHPARSTFDQVGVSSGRARNPPGACGMAKKTIHVNPTVFAFWCFLWIH